MFGGYIASHKKGIIVWVIVCAVFALVFSLYGLPVLPVLYGTLLSGFFGAVFFIFDFVSYRRKCIALQSLAEKITIAADELPMPENSIEKEYERLIGILYEALKTSESFPI